MFAIEKNRLVPSTDFVGNRQIIRTSSYIKEVSILIMTFNIAATRSEGDPRNIIFLVKCCSSVFNYQRCTSQ